MNAGPQPVIGMSDTLNTTGLYTYEVPCPRSRTTATIRWGKLGQPTAAEEAHLILVLLESVILGPRAAQKMN